MKRFVRLIKKNIAIVLIVVLCINSFAAIVSDNDGSAFITKAEFDSLKNDFQSQINNYQTSLDSKIDGAIASYLAGIRVSNKTTQPLLLWSNATLGLVEQPDSHKYVEGTVGGSISIDAFIASNEQWINGNNSITANLSVSIPYLCYCYHVMENKNNDKFKYLVASYGKNNSEVVWDLEGYATVDEKLNLFFRFSKSVDYTYSGCYSIGLCSGWDSSFGNIGVDISKQSGTLLGICETRKKATNYTKGYEYKRGETANYSHNMYELPNSKASLNSDIIIDNNYKYLTNFPKKATYNDIFPSKWYGTNKTNGSDTHTKKFDLYGSGWRMPETGNQIENFHIKADYTHTSLYACDNKSYMRKVKTSGDLTSSEESSGWIKGYDRDGSNHYYYNPNDYKLKNLFKSTTGTSCLSDNLYSSEIGNVLYSLEPSLVKTGTFEGQSKKISPLYIGLPLGQVKEGDIVNINLGFLDDTDYEVAFKIGAFDQTKVEETTYDNAGLSIKGQNGNKRHRKTFSGIQNKSIQVEIEKGGVLFFKFGVTGKNMGRMKLPENIIIEKTV